MKVYLAGPHTADAHRRAATEYLRAYGFELIDPMRRDFRGIEDGHEQEIVRGDLADVVECDAILANFSANSVGTSMECWFGYSIGRPVVSFFEGGRRSPWAVYISEACFGFQDEAMRYLVKFRDSGMAGR